MKKQIGLLCLFAAAFFPVPSAFAANTFPVSGNVGIGTTSPANPLYISTSINAPLYLYGTNSQQTGMYMENSNTTNIWGIGSWANGNFTIDQNGVGNRFVIDGNGNVGIGTTSLSYMLDMDGTSSGTSNLFHFKGDNSSLIYMDMQNTSTAVPGSGVIQRWITENSAGTATTSLDMAKFSGGLFAINNYDTSGVITMSTAGTQRIQIDSNGLQLNTLGGAGSTAVCLNSTNRLASCSSSIRYKENVENLSLGLKDVMRMRPVTFKWKDGNQADLGLIAEEMHDINPMYSTYRDGRIEGVKYTQLTAVLINAIKEQQQEISDLKRAVADLKTASAATLASVQPY